MQAAVDNRGYHACQGPRGSPDPDREDAMPRPTAPGPVAGTAAASRRMLTGRAATEGRMLIGDHRPNPIDRGEVAGDGFRFVPVRPRLDSRRGPTQACRSWTCALSAMFSAS
jgi:hypothetical protein